MEIGWYCWRNFGAFCYTCQEIQSPCPGQVTEVLVSPQYIIWMCFKHVLWNLNEDNVLTFPCAVLFKFQVSSSQVEALWVLGLSHIRRKALKYSVTYNTRSHYLACVALGFAQCQSGKYAGLPMVISTHTSIHLVCSVIFSVRTSGVFRVLISLSDRTPEVSYSRLNRNGSVYRI